MKSLIILILIFLLENFPHEGDNSTMSCFFSNFEIKKSTNLFQNTVDVNFRVSFFDCSDENGKLTTIDVLLDINELNTINNIRTFFHEQDKFEYSMLAHHKLSLFELSQTENEILLTLNKIPHGDHCLRFLLLDGSQNVIVEDFNFTLP